MQRIFAAGRMLGAASSLTLAAVISSLATTPVLAQVSEDAGAQGATADNPETIIVTGSRVARSGFEAPTPVTVVGSEQLRMNSDTNVGEALNRLPSFRPQSSGAVMGFTQVNAGSLILDLRGLGAQRTLVLIDGRRSVASTTQGTFDLNLIPSNIISRAEVVTGGASAAYGSDAVAGVVNLIVDTRRTGFQAEGQFGISTHGDNEEYRLNGSFGSDVFDGRGHIVVAAEYVDSAGMADCFSYSFCSPDGISNYFSTVNPGGAGANGLPAQMLGYVHMANMTQAGLISSGPLRGTQFSPDGSVSSEPYVFGINASPTATFMIGGSGRMLVHENILLKAPYDRFATFVNLDYDVTDSISMFVQASYGRVHASAHGAQPFDNALVIRRDNAFLPASIAAQMDELGIDQFTLGRQTTEGGISQTEARRSNFRAATGLRGDLGGGWSWDAYYQYGETDNIQSSTNNKINANFTRAIDSVLNGSGVPVCRSTLADPGNGCAPANPFGIGNFSPQAIAYAFGTSQSNFHYTQHVVAANLRGEPFSTWAGPVSLAAGGEYRADSVLGTADPISARSGFFTNNAAPIDGDIKVVEGYAEAVVPLASDMAFARRLELNGAIRQTHYRRENSFNAATTVDATTWKIGGIWEPITGIRFRATRSRDIRAPNMVELFSEAASTQTFIADPITNANENVTTFTGGNAALAPEKADTTTVGVILSPDRAWLGATISFSVDYFNVEVDGAIATLGGQTLVNRCAAGITEFCQFVTRDPVTNRIVRLDNVNLNLNSLIARGIDFEFLFSTGLEGLSIPGELTFRALATNNIALTTIDSSGTRTNRAGMNGFPTGQLSGVPDWTIDTSLTYRSGPATVSIQTHTLTGGLYDVTLIGPEQPGYSVNLPNSINTNWLEGRTFVHLSASYKFSDRLEVFGSINNIFNATPPPGPTAVAPYNPVLYDPTGRYFRLGVRTSF